LTFYFPIRLATGDFPNELAEVWLLKLLKFPAPVLGGKIPFVGRGAHKSAHWHGVAEINEGHGDDFIDNARQLAPRLRAFQLNLKKRPLEFVAFGFKNRDQDDVPLARMLQVAGTVRSVRARRFHKLREGLWRRFW
jgi:hypothetical protein